MKNIKQTTITIGGMSCAGCVSTAQKAILKLDGIETASVNLATEKATIKWDDSITKYPTIADAIKKAGFSVVPEYTSITAQVSGLNCAMCVATVESTIRKLDGVEAASVNLATENAKIKYDTNLLDFDAISKAVQNAGFGLKQISTDDSLKDNLAQIENRKNKQLLDIRNRFLWSMFFALPLLIYSMVPMMLMDTGILPMWLNPHHQPVANMLVQTLLCIPVVIVNLQLYYSGFKKLFQLKPNMESLIATGTTVAFVYSFWLSIENYFFSKHHMPYFEMVAVILALVALGKYYETKMKGKTGSAITKLMQLAPTTATVLRDGVETSVDIETIVVGDTLVSRPGEKFAVDGVLVSGKTHVDEAMLTGESMPVAKSIGDSVIGSSINLNSWVQYKATKVGKDTTLSKIVRLVEDAQDSKAPIARLADVVSGYFTYFVIGVAVLSGLLWAIFSSNDIGFAIGIFIAVMVVACPCALGLATPTSIMVGTGKGAENGILIKGGEALEILANVDTVLLDKTGTITQGKPTVSDLIVVDSTFSEAKILSILSSVENKSEHPLGQAIVSYVKTKGGTLTHIDDFQALSGLGVTAKYNGKAVAIGNNALMQRHNINTHGQANKFSELSQAGKTAMYIGIDNKLVAVVAVRDQIKDTSVSAVSKLKAKGIEVYMLTGDNKTVAEAIAKEVGITHVHADMLPQDKSELVKKLQSEGKKVGFVGDGINDAIALTQADVGLAIGRGTDIAIESAQVVLMRDDLNSVGDAITLSKMTLTNIKQNLFWALCYNSIGIPVAAGVLYLFGGPLLDPMIAALAMAFSSVSVLLNVLRLKAKRIS